MHVLGGDTSVRVLTMTSSVLRVLTPVIGSCWSDAGKFFEMLTGLQR